MSKRPKTKPGKLEMPDFCNDVTQLLVRYHDAGCLAEVLFKSAVAMVATAGSGRLPPATRCSPG